MRSRHASTPFRPPTPVLFALLACALLLAAPALAQGKQRPNSGCPPEVTYCRNTAQYRFEDGGRVDVVMDMLEDLPAGSPPRFAPGDAGTLVLVVMPPESADPVHVLFRVNETPGVAWEGDAERAFFVEPGQEPREEVFPFQVTRETSGPLALPIVLQMGNETAYHEEVLEVEGSEPPPPPPPPREEVPIQSDDRCSTDPAYCASGNASEPLKVGSVTVRIQGSDVEGPAILASPGTKGTVWLRALREELEAEQVNVTFRLDDIAPVKWQQTFAEAVFTRPAPDSTQHPETVSILGSETPFVFQVPEDAKPGRVLVPFSVTVGNETRHAAFFLDIVPAGTVKPIDAPSPAPTPTPGPGAALAALALALAAVALARRRRGA